MNLPDVPEPESSSKTFLKLKDGESLRGVFIGEMYIFYTKWVNGKSIETESKDPEGKVRFRNNIALVDPLTHELTVKIWEFPWSVFAIIREINFEYPLETIKVKITRTGTGVDTTYSVLPLVSPKDLLTKEKITAINSMPLLPLVKPKDLKSKPHDPDEIPF